MSLRERKQIFMEEVMKVNDESVIKELETILWKASKKPGVKGVIKREKSLKDFFGVLSKEEGEGMKNAIEEMFEIVDLMKESISTSDTTNRCGSILTGTSAF